MQAPMYKMEFSCSKHIKKPDLKRKTGVAFWAGVTFPDFYKPHQLEEIDLEDCLLEAVSDAIASPVVITTEMLEPLEPHEHAHDRLHLWVASLHDEQRNFNNAEREVWQQHNPPLVLKRQNAMNM